jgi:ribosome-associated heat shock protein Hsp15
MAFGELRELGVILRTLSGPGRGMRLDLFLKRSRLCLRRTSAQRLCDLSLVSVNGSAAKSARTVKPGDEIAIRRRDRVTKIRVVSVPTSRQTSRQEASSLYEPLSEELLDTDPT